MAEEELIETELDENRPLPQTLNGIEVYKDKFLVFHHEKLNIVATDEEHKSLVKKAQSEAVTYLFSEIKSLKYRSHFGKGVLKITWLEDKKKASKEVFIFGGKHGTTNMGAVVLSLDMNKLKYEFKRFQEEHKE